MLRNVENLHRELDRLRRPRSATVIPTPGGQAVEVHVGDELDIAYAGEARHVRVLAITPTGLRCWDVDKQAMRCFRLDRIGVGMPPEMDSAAQA